MNHQIKVDKFGIRLRPVTMKDANFIYDLRHDPKLSQYIGEFPQDRSIHLQWLRAYFLKDDDIYFIIELMDGTPVGTISIYDMTEQTGNWGRWIIKHPIPAAPASAWLIYYVAFDILQLPEVYTNTVSNNEHIVSFHDHCGLTRTAIQKGGLTIKNIDYDLVIHTAKRDDWPFIHAQLQGPAQTASRFLVNHR